MAAKDAIQLLSGIPGHADNCQALCIIIHNDEYLIISAPKVDGKSYKKVARNAGWTRPTALAKSSLLA
jgi:hypothetical protein